MSHGKAQYGIQVAFLGTHFFTVSINEEKVGFLVDVVTNVVFDD